MQGVSRPAAVGVRARRSARGESCREQIATRADGGSLPGADLSGVADLNPRIADPADNAGYTDLTLVDGARLTSYNQGNVVPLYNNYGDAQSGFPAVCGTYYDTESNLPKSVWMFCTDLGSHTCADVGPGMTLTHAGTAVGDMHDRSGNSRLTHDQEAIIAWLISNPRDTIFNGTTRPADLTDSDSRLRLQFLVWCVSDLGLMNSAMAPGFCAANLTAADQAQIRTMVPDAIVANLGMTSAGSVATVGDRATITLSTNVFNQPITLAQSGTATGTLRVCGGPATLTGTSLTVTGADPTTPLTIKLCCWPVTSPPGRTDPVRCGGWPRPVLARS